MDLGEVEEVLKWDQRFGVVNVMSEDHVPIDGFTIGGNAGAGAACLHAASEETEEIESKEWQVKQHIESKMISERWSDDLLLIWDLGVMKATQDVIKTITSEGFYGGELKLEDQGEKANEAFGFEIRVAGGVVTTRPVMKFRKEFGARGLSRTVPELQGGLQYTPVSRTKAAVGARFLRILDMSNGPEEDVVEQVARKTAEMLLADYDKEMIQGILQKVQSESWLDLKKVIQMARNLTKDEVRVKADEYDRRRQEELEEDYTTARSERKEYFVEKRIMGEGRKIAR